MSVSDRCVCTELHSAGPALSGRSLIRWILGGSWRAAGEADCWRREALTTSYGGSKSFLLERFRGGEFAVHVRLRARASGMQDTTFSDLDATGGTRDRGQLFRGKFVHIHSDIMREAAAARQFNLAHFPDFFGTPPYGIFPFGAEGGLVMQNDAEERIINVDFAVGVVDEAHIAEFVHEEIHAGAGGADHLRQRLLRYLGK